MPMLLTPTVRYCRARSNNEEWVGATRMVKSQAIASTKGANTAGLRAIPRQNAAVTQPTASNAIHVTISPGQAARAARMHHGAAPTTTAAIHTGHHGANSGSSPLVGWTGGR